MLVKWISRHLSYDSPVALGDSAKETLARGMSLRRLEILLAKARNILP